MIRGNRPSFTQAERAVLVLIASGLKPKQMVGRLAISRCTLQRLLTTIRKKFGATNDAQVGILIERYQLVDVRTQNIIEDRREERLDARRLGAQ